MTRQELVTWLSLWWLRLRTHWASMGLRQRIVVGAITIMLVVGVTALALRKGTTCTTREDAEARLAIVTSQLQQVASGGGMSMQAFAGALKDLNEAASILNTRNDPKVYCERLAAIAREHAAE